MLCLPRFLCCALNKLTSFIRTVRHYYCSTRHNKREESRVWLQWRINIPSEVDMTLARLTTNMFILSCIAPLVRTNMWLSFCARSSKIYYLSAERWTSLIGGPNKENKKGSAPVFWSQSNEVQQRHMWSHRRITCASQSSSDARKCVGVGMQWRCSVFVGVDSRYSIWDQVFPVRVTNNSQRRDMTHDKLWLTPWRSIDIIQGGSKQEGYP